MPKAVKQPKGKAARSHNRRPAAPRHATSGRHTAPASAKAPAILLSACLIVKDEVQTLPDCLRSLNSLVDEVVVYDTGSTDGTQELARRAGARVIQGYWDDDFSRARNASLEHCQGEWVLWIDADERFVVADPREMRGALQNLGNFDALLVEIRNLMGDGSKMGNLHRAFRLFRKETCLWFGALHEQVDIRPGLDRHVRAAPLEGAHLLHLGYMDEYVRERDKLTRNLRLAEAVVAAGLCAKDQEGVPELNLGRALCALSRYQEAQPHMEVAVAKTHEGAPRRSALLYSVHNLSALGRYQDALDLAEQLEKECEKKGLSYYLQGASLRRLGRPEEAVAILAKIDAVSNEDGFALPDYIMRAELAGSLLEVGRTTDAADELVKLIRENPDVMHLSAAFRVFAITGQPLEALIQVMPEDALEKVAAALVLVPPVVADQMAEALWSRFGAKPELRAAAIRFAPLLPVGRALDWSARIRAIGMANACPLLAQARWDVLDPAERVRAAVTAYSAFGDPIGAELALALVAGVVPTKLAGVLAEVNVLAPSLLTALALAACGPSAQGTDGGSGEERSATVCSVMSALGYEQSGPGDAKPEAL